MEFNRQLETADKQCDKKPPVCVEYASLNEQKYEARRYSTRRSCDVTRSYSRRRSVSIAALSAGSVTPSSRATCPHRIGRRRDFLETGHCVQASTSRSPFAGRCFAAHRWQAIRSVKTFGVMTNTRPDRSQPWKCFSSLMCEM